MRINSFGLEKHGKFGLTFCLKNTGGLQLVRFFGPGKNRTMRTSY